MAFELLAWIYISVICLVWGNLFVRVFFRNGPDVAEFDFPVLCFIGMAVIGIGVLYLSIFLTVNGAVKWLLQFPALLYFLRASNRHRIFNQLKRPFAKCSGMDLFLLTVCLMMVLFLSTSPIIHPDTLHYHIYSIQVFEKYGVIPGVVNLQLEFGFQSLWFAVMNVFYFSHFQSGISYPLSGAVLSWFIIFLISKLASGNISLQRSKKGDPAAGFLLLLIFTLLSWTQIRLTASSASPDFVVSISVFLAFYFFVRNLQVSKEEYGFYFALFFASTAFAIKLSAVLLMLMLIYVLFYGIIRGKFQLAAKSSLLVAFFLMPVIIRNIISTGYPFFPSAFVDVFHFDWKLSEVRLGNFRHYITAYARYPVSGADAEAEYAVPFSGWLPVWWRHLYMADKMLMLILLIGGLADLVFFRRWIKAFTVKIFMAFIISLAGSILWFVSAPDPRFGTGFLLALIYFQYFPFFISWKFSETRLFFEMATIVKFILALLIVVYVVYRGIYFFHPGQLIFPDGVKKITPAHPDCNDYMKERVFGDSSSALQLPDSCKTFLFRGSSIKAGFKPLE